MADIPKFFGIDIGYNSLKVCMINAVEKNLEVMAFGKQEIAKNLLQGVNEEDIEALGDKITALVKATKIDTKNCVIALPENAVFSRILSLPKIEDEKVAQAVYWGMKPVIPIALEDVNVSYVKVNDFMQGDKPFTNWYAVAAPKNLVTKYETVIKNLGLNLLAIETETLANTRTLVANYDLAGDEVIVDFGAHTSNIILVRNGKPAFSQTLEVGSDLLTRAIATDFGIDVVQAENYKVSYGYDTTAADGRMAKAMGQSLEALVSEISRTLVYFRDKLAGNAVNKIYLSGGGANLKNLNSFINSKLGIECIVAEPFRKLKLSAAASKQLEATKSISSLNLVVGLALKGFIND